MRWNEHLRHLRNSQGWSQTALGKKLGTNTHTISRWERGNAFPSPFYRERLAQVFEKSLEELGLVPEFESYSIEHALAPEFESYGIRNVLAPEFESSYTQQAWPPPDLDLEPNEEDTIRALFTQKHTEPLLEGPIPQVGKVFTTPFWLGFALSGIVSLTAAIIIHHGKSPVL
ncbi:MAG TPA: helix-turn-helix transcriptional regulator [Ktedonobacteraceae bacterium]|jgi:transcriptional regulator with XRE-family HTH domain